MNLDRRVAKFLKLYKRIRESIYPNVIVESPIKKVVDQIINY